jgi:hypothetical protein
MISQNLFRWRRAVRVLFQLGNRVTQCRDRAIEMLGSLYKALLSFAGVVCKAWTERSRINLQSYRLNPCL